MLADQVGALSFEQTAHLLAQLGDDVDFHWPSRTPCLPCEHLRVDDRIPQPTPAEPAGEELIFDPPTHPPVDSAAVVAPHPSSGPSTELGTTDMAAAERIADRCLQMDGSCSGRTWRPSYVGRRRPCTTARRCAPHQLRIRFLYTALLADP